MYLCGQISATIFGAVTEKCDPLIGNLTLLFAVLLQLGQAAAGSGMLERVISDTNFQDTFQNEKTNKRERDSAGKLGLGR